MWHAMRRLTYVCTGLCLKNLSKRRRMHVRQNNIKTDLEEISLQDVNQIDLDQGRDKQRTVVNAAMNLQVPNTLLIFFQKEYAAWTYW